MQKEQENYVIYFNIFHKERESEGKGQKLNLEGTILGSPASLEFSPARVVLKLPKPVNTADETAIEMVKNSLAFVDAWTTFTSQLKDPRNSTQMEAFEDMLALTYVLRERRSFVIPDKDMDIIVERFERACHTVGINNSEAALVMTSSILRQFNKEMAKNSLSARLDVMYEPVNTALHHPTFNGYVHYNGVGFEKFLETTKYILKTPYLGSRGEVYSLAPLPILLNAVTSSDNSINSSLDMFLKLGLISSDRTALEIQLITRVLSVVGGVDTVMAEYFKRIKPDVIQMTDGHMVIGAQSFEALGQDLTNFCRAIGRNPELTMEKAEVVGTGVHLIENSAFLNNAQHVVLDEDQTTDFNKTVNKIINGKRHVPVMFIGLTGSGKSTLSATLGEMIMAKRKQTKEDLVLYEPKGEELGEKSVQAVEKALLEFTIDALANGDDGKFRYLVLDDIHKSVRNAADWSRIHILLNLINPYLAEDSNSAIVITSEETPESAALRSAHRVEEFRANALWREGKSIQRVRADIIYALTEKPETRLDPKIARTVADTLIVEGKTQADATGVPTTAINFGFVINTIADGILNGNPPDVTAYIREKVKERFAAIKNEVDAKKANAAELLIQEESAKTSAAFVEVKTLLDNVQKELAAMRENAVTVDQHTDLLQKVEALDQSDKAKTAQLLDLAEELRLLKEQAVLVRLEEHLSPASAAAAAAETKTTNIKTATPLRANLVMSRRNKPKKA
ncbi:hypothetical protein HY041_02055 [Candidatus Roizmanbacteria bacterium]|nr:hypothetical protein [Candidatus Roizmanbacteria bacterium]